jgi:hypothetical protein
MVWATVRAAGRVAGERPGGNDLAASFCDDGEVEGGRLRFLPVSVASDLSDDRLQDGTSKSSGLASI